jgi:hypothetical protein
MRVCRKFIGRAARLGAFAALTVALGGWGWDWDEGCGCYPTEFVTRQAGDAVQVNKNIQMIDPWPHYVKNRKLNLDGHRASIAMRRYQANQVIQPSPLSAQMARENTNNGNAPAPLAEQQ